MAEINIIIKETLVNLKNNSLEATPNAYHKEFCKVAKKYNFKVSECSQFLKLLEKLTLEEQNIIKEKNVETMEDLLPILLERVSSKNVSTLATLIKQSLSPSINIKLDESLTNFSIKIGNSPELMFEEEIQKEMQNFISRRFEADQSIVKQKTSDIAKLVTLMGKYLNDAIHSSTYGSDHVSTIKNELVSINLENESIKKLSDLQGKLIKAATTIETEMKDVSKKLSSGKTQVTTLESKIKLLESELSSTKKEVLFDHLTGLLTRRAYEQEVKILENTYVRNNSLYAIIFFDIDHFKKVNDSYGHKAGDIVLSTFSKILKNQTRDCDIVSRYGGEEFIAIIQYKAKSELLLYLKRIKNIIRDNHFKFNDVNIAITFSAGVVLRPDHPTYESAIQKSDILMYKAKETGRNKIVFEDGTII